MFDDEIINQMYNAYLSCTAEDNPTKKSVEDLVSVIYNVAVKLILLGDVARKRFEKKEKAKKLVIPCSEFYFPDYKRTVYYEKHRNYRIYQPKRKIPIITEDYDVR